MLDAIGHAEEILAQLGHAGLSATALGAYAGISKQKFSRILTRQVQPTPAEAEAIDRAIR